jgi:hypothetical protein
MAVLMCAPFASATEVLTAEKSNEGVDLCYYKQLSLAGYAFANLIGRCAWDPAQNGMQLSLVSVSEDPTQDGQRIEIDNVRAVLGAKSVGGCVEIRVLQDSQDIQGRNFQIQKTLSVRPLDQKKGTFRLTVLRQSQR